MKTGDTIDRLLLKVEREEEIEDEEFLQALLNDMITQEKDKEKLRKRSVVHLPLYTFPPEA